MAQNKKDFTAEAAGVFVDKMIAPTDAPKPKAKKAAQAKQQPLEKKKPRTNAAGTEIKICVMLDGEIERKVRYIAFAERSKQKTIIHDALLNYITDYEAANGEPLNVIIEMPQPDEHGNRYKVITEEGGERVENIIDTREHAQQFLHIEELNV